MIDRNEKGRFCKGIVPWNKGKRGVYSKEVLKIMSDAKKGYIPWNKGLKLPNFKSWNKGLRGILKPNKTSFKKGRILSKEIEEKRLKNLKEKINLKPNLEMTEDLAYILGIIKGDGCIYKNNRTYKIVLDITNKNIAIDFLNSLKKIGLNPSTRERMPSNGIGKLKKYVIIAQSSYFGVWYKNLSIDNLKNLLKKEECIIGFIRGFYEAEGSISKRHDRYNTITISIYNTDLKIMRVVKYLTDKLGFNFNLNGPYKNNGFDGKSSKPIYRIHTSRKYDTNKFINVIKPVGKILNKGVDLYGGI